MVSTSESEEVWDPIDVVLTQFVRVQYAKLGLLSIPAESPLVGPVGG